MQKPEFAIFNLKTARMVLRHIMAFCGLMAILLTASCGPSSSGSKTKPIPITDEQNEVPESSSQSETREKIEILPAEGNSESQLREKQETVQEITPDVKKETPETKIIPMGDTLNAPRDASPESTSASAGSQTEVKASGNESKEVQATVASLSSNYLWATMPTFVDSYKDPNGQVIEHFKVSPGSQELQDILAKMRDDLVSRNHSSSSLKLNVKETGSCEGNADASTKSCDTNAPICLSLENIKSANPQATLEQSLRPLIMREFARQHCADEALAKQVQQYYELPAIQKFNLTNQVFSIFTRLRANLTQLKAALTTGIMPNAGQYAQRIDSKEDICGMIAKGSKNSQLLQDQVVLSGFVQDPKDAAKSPRVMLTETIKGMNSFCASDSSDRQDLLQRVDGAIQLYDQLAQEFSKNSRVIIRDFSKYLWPFENTDGSQN